VSNHVIIRLIRFVSRFTVHLCNAIYFSIIFSTLYKRFIKNLYFSLMDLNRASTEFVRGLTFEDLDHSVDDIILEKIDFMDSSFAFCDIRHCPSTVRWHIVLQCTGRAWLPRAPLCSDVHEQVPIFISNLVFNDLAGGEV